MEHTEREPADHKRLGLMLGSVVATTFLLFVCVSSPIETAGVRDAYRSGNLEMHQAVVSADYTSGLDGSDRGGGTQATDQDVTVTLTDTGQKLKEDTAVVLDVEDDQVVTVGLWGNELITIGSTYVYQDWSIGVLLAYLLLPASVVLTILQAYRIGQLRRTERPGRQSLLFPHVIGAFGLSFLGICISGVAIGTSGLELLWGVIPTSTISTLWPLARFVREQRDRRLLLPPDASRS